MNIEKLLKFSILFNKYYYYLLKENEQDKRFRYTDIDGVTAEEMCQMCKSYIDWIREIIVKTNDDGKIDYDNCNEDISWFNSRYKELFSSAAIESSVSGFSVFKKRKYNYSVLENMANLTKEKTGQTGEQLISELAEQNGTGGLKSLICDFYEICK